MITLKSFERCPNLAELKVSYKRRRKTQAGKPARSEVIGCAFSAEAYLRSVWCPDSLELVEEFLIVCLNGGHEVLGWVKVSRGGFGQAVVDPRVVFAVALQAASSAIILAHNHPGGTTEPSPEDIDITRRLAQAGTLLRIPVLDHIILTRDRVLSFAERGLI